MQSAETVLGVLRERGRRGLPLDELYRQLFNPELYYLAYGNIYSNKGAMTPGPDGETADGMSRGKIDRITNAMRHERYRFQPVRRVYIPKKNGKLRPLGMPSWSDKLVGEVIHLLLEAYYEPHFSGSSHGFRRGRGCHTALSEVSETWTATAWFIESDISDCFGSFDHEVMMSILGEKILDNRFLRLIKQMLQAGYLEDWEYHETLSGVPQGGVVSPVLSNIYLHRMDEFVETVLIPEYTRGKRRTSNPAYFRIRSAMRRARARGDRAQVRKLHAQQRGLPSSDPNDPGYRRLRYVRYADDALLGFAGPKAEAEDIKSRLAAFLRDDLRLELNEDKTLLTHARTGAAKFLGYEVTVWHSKTRPRVNGTVRLKVPPSVIKAKCSQYFQHGKPERRTGLLNFDDALIVSTYGSEYRGVVQYYLLASDVWKLNRLEWAAKTSMLKTLAAKHRSRVSHMARKYQATTDTPQGKRNCFEVVTERPGRKPLVARLGGIPLQRQKRAVIDDRPAVPRPARKKELVTRLRKGRCEWCQRIAAVESHHVRKLADLTQGQLDDQPGQFTGQGRASRGLGLGPFPGDHAPVPAQQCSRADDPVCPQRFGQDPGQCGEQRPVRPVDSRLGVAAAQHRHLVPQDQDLGVLRRRRPGRQRKP